MILKKYGNRFPEKDIMSILWYRVVAAERLCLNLNLGVVIEVC